MVLVKIRYIDGKKEAMIYDLNFTPFSVVVGFFTLDEALEFINETNKKA